MDHHPNATAARLLLTLSVLPTALLVPAVAAADTAAPGTGATKAQVEHGERAAASAAPGTKAQVEHREQAAATSAATTARTASTATRGHASTGSRGGDAAAWQLALSAALGAVLTGGALLTGRQVTHHRRPVAS